MTFGEAHEPFREGRVTHRQHLVLLDKCEGCGQHWPHGRRMRRRMDIGDLIERVGAQAKKSGFRTPGFTRSVAEHVALITTEIGELYEEHRDGRLPGELWYEHKGRTGPDRFTRTPVRELDEDPAKPVGIDFELADIVIRACDMASEDGIDLVRAIEEKMAYNATRPLKHGRQS